jgi:hypothetical protein
MVDLEYIVILWFCWSAHKKIFGKSAQGFTNCCSTLALRKSTGVSNE